ncbi:MAG: ATP-binding cassette domain-containing protein [Eubacteriales bacterium]|nr:ATP-binding cassette domain-containing protein [Eubacteriales bacterium]MDD3882163.1 ATP-binding cassette domain-containing protein [Eubacteriales bacterium]MDD4513793.1 ATP-binding cassette domain-containing protein [Eubacteriales bacterium]
MKMGFDNLYKSYGDKKVLSGVSFSIEEKGRICFFGPSGCGKTTAMRICLGLEAPDSGSVFGFSEIAASAQFQENRLLKWRSAAENLMIACDIDKDTAVSELEKAGIANGDKIFPSELSGGMKRRVSLIRAMLKKSDIVFLDEPCKEMDDALKQRMLRYISDKISSRALVIITHDISEAYFLVGSDNILDFTFEMQSDISNK